MTANSRQKCSLDQRVKAEVERRLAAYASPPTEARIDAELIGLIKAGLTTEQPLPQTLPPVEQPVGQGEREARRSRRSRRG
jgi:hypothetical protein